MLTNCVSLVLMRINPQPQSSEALPMNYVGSLSYTSFPRTKHVVHFAPTCSDW